MLNKRKRHCSEPLPRPRTAGRRTPADGDAWISNAQQTQRRLEGRTIIPRLTPVAAPGLSRLSSQPFPDRRAPGNEARAKAKALPFPRLNFRQWRAPSGKIHRQSRAACLQGMTHLRGKALSPTAALPLLSPPCFAAHVLLLRLSAQPQSDKPPPADLHHPSRPTPSDRGSGAL